MLQQPTVLATAQPSQTPTATVPASDIAGWGLIFLLVGASWMLNRRRSTRSPQRFDKLPPLAEVQFTQPLQWINWAKQLEQSQQYEEAVTIYDRGLKDFPNDFRLWHERGLALAKLQHFEKALVSYDRAAQIRPAQPDLAHERGDALLQLERFAEAIDCFDVYLQYAPDNAHVLADRGYALFRLGCYEEALRSLEKVLKGNRWEESSVVHARYYQIEALRQSGRLEAAMQAAQEALAQHPQEQFKTQFEALKRLKHS